jgi:hypothetical protein
MAKHSKTFDDAPASQGGRPRSAPSPAPTKAAAQSTRTVTRPPEESWTEVANFVLTFERRVGAVDGQTEKRITAHKMQEGGITANWTGVAQQPMCEWIAQHVGDWARAQAQAQLEEVAPTLTTEEIHNEEIQQGDTETLAPPAAAAPPAALGLAVAQVRALQAIVETVPGGSPAAPSNSRASFKSGEAFSLEALIEINGLGDAQPLDPAAACSVQFFSRNTVTSEAARLGEACVAEPVNGQSSYRAVLRRVRLPAGTYRLESVATLKGMPPKHAYGQGPVLQVV